MQTLTKPWLYYLYVVFLYCYDAFLYHYGLILLRKI